MEIIVRQELKNRGTQINALEMIFAYKCITSTLKTISR